MNKEKILAHLVLNFQDSMGRNPDKKELLFLKKEAIKILNTDNADMRKDKRRTGFKNKD